MKDEAKSNVRLVANVVGIAGVMLILAGLIWAMYYFTRPEPVDQARWVERKRTRTEIDVQTKEQLDNYAWLDRDRAIVRLPIARAVQLTEVEWQDPAAGRSNLLALLDKFGPPTNAPAAGTNAPPASTNAPAGASTNAPAAAAPK